MPPSAIARAVRGFRGIEHVLEHVATLDGVAFYNDSKATNVEAARRSLEAFTAPVVVILGGRYKGGDFAELAPALGAHGRAVVVIGEASERSMRPSRGLLPLERASSLADAVATRSLAHARRCGAARAGLLVFRHVPGLRRARARVQGRGRAALGRSRLAGGSRG